MAADDSSTRKADGEKKSERKRGKENGECACERVRISARVSNILFLLALAKLIENEDATRTFYPLLFFSSFHPDTADKIRNI